jgi:5-methylcytosine-specific restriction protein A
MVWGTASRQSRGYGAAWDKIRPRIMKRDCGMCQPCKRNGRATLGNQVDHIISKAKAKRMGWTSVQMDADSNLQCICEDCHKDKTALERGFTPKPVTGKDGWPVE